MSDLQKNILKRFRFTFPSDDDGEKNKLTEENDVHLRLAKSARNSLK